jgi:hypothetical protein
MNRIAFDDEQLKELQKEFLNAQNSTDISRAFVGERCMTMSVLEDPAMVDPDMLGYEMPPMFVLQAYKALGLADNEMVIYLDFNNEIMKVFDLSLHKRIKEFEAIEMKYNSISKMYILFHQFMPGFSRIIQIDLRNIAELRAAQVSIAIERYRLTNKILPASLNELVPDYIEDIPLDPFDGKQMRYKKRVEGGFVIYSIGEDLIDDNGKKQPQNSRERSQTTWDIPFIVER